MFFFLFYAGEKSDLWKLKQQTLGLHKAELQSQGKGVPGNVSKAWILPQENIVRDELLNGIQSGP